MSKFKHTHVMGLIGVCVDGGSAPYIVMPYMANGSLLNYLKKERNGHVLFEDSDEYEVEIHISSYVIICQSCEPAMFSVHAQHTYARKIWVGDLTYYCSFTTQGVVRPK